VQLQYAAKTLDIQHLFIVEADRGCGAGRALIDAACQRAKTLGCHRATLGVVAQNAPAIALYEACGFTPRDKHHALGMVRHL